MGKTIEIVEKPIQNKSYSDIKKIDFEKLEGRRFYLKSLIEKIVSTARVSDLKY